MDGNVVGFCGGGGGIVFVCIVVGAVGWVVVDVVGNGAGFGGDGVGHVSIVVGGVGVGGDGGLIDAFAACHDYEGLGIAAYDESMMAVVVVQLMVVPVYCRHSDDGDSCGGAAAA